MIRLGELKREINEILASLTTYVKLCNGQGKYDINKDAEAFYGGLCEIVFSENESLGFGGKQICLRRLENIRQDFPAIDLGDEANGVAVQVTSTESRGKVSKTLKTFFRHNLHNTYTRLLVLVIGSRESYTDRFKLDQSFDFDAGRDVLDTSSLGRLIDGLNEQRLVQLNQYLEKSLNLHRPSEGFFPKLPVYSSLAQDGFVGRQEELETLARELAEGVKPIVITGLGGMGKTELAVRFCRDMSREKVMFVTFNESFRRTITQNMAEGVPGLLGKNLDEQTIYRQVMDHLRRRGEDHILIIDNVDAEGVSLSDLQNCPEYRELKNMSLRLILTTRISTSRSIQVPPMEPEQLYDIFRNHGLELPKQEMDDLIKAVNRHTMTIDLMARTIAEPFDKEVTPRMLLDALRRKESSGDGLPEVGTDYNRSDEQRVIDDHLCTLFQVADLPEEAKGALTNATLLPRDGMDKDLFRNALPRAHRGALNKLGTHGWLNLVGPKVSIHPVIRSVCRKKLGPDDEKCGAFLDALANPHEYHGDRVRQLAELYANAADDLPDQVGSWALWAGGFWSQLGQMQTALRYELRTVERREQSLSPDDPALAAAYNNVGITYGYLGDYDKALEHKRKALELQKKVLPPDHPDLARSYNNVGTTYGYLGDHDKALEYKLKALELRKKILPPDHPDIAGSYNNVGVTYSHLGDHDKALEYKLKALELWKKVLLPDHPDLASSYNNVGVTYGHLGDHKQALEYQLKDLEICKKVLPPDHPDLASSYNNVGVTYGALGDHKQALEYKLKALELQKKVLPPDHPDLAKSYNNVGVTYYYLGSLSLAVEHFGKAVDIMESTLGREHPDTVLYRKNLEFLLSIQNS